MRFRLLFLSVTAAAGCNAILGNESATYSPPAVDGGNTPPPPSTNDAGTNEEAGPRDAGACAETNLQTDPKNCGSCFHDCLGGECASGLCQPLVLATEPGTFPGPVALDNDFVYWSNSSPSGGNGDIKRVPKDGGSPQLLFHPSVVGTTRDIGVAGGRVYFPGDSTNGVASCPVAGCADGGRIEVPTTSAVQSVVVKENTIWLVEQTGSTVTKCAIPCTTSVPLSTTDPNPLRVSGFGNVGAWTNVNGHLFGSYDGGHFDIDLTPSFASGVVVTDAGIFTEHTKLGPLVYGLDGGGDGGHVWNGMPLGNSQNLAVDDQIHFTDLDKVVSCPLAGCADGGIIRVDAAHPRGIATDGKALYWARDGAIVKVAR